MNKKIVLCIGDSLGMPRPGVEYTDTWYYLLKEAFPEYEFVPAFKRHFKTAIII